VSTLCGRFAISPCAQLRGVVLSTMWQLLGSA
jgi:hypothetical protein